MPFVTVDGVRLHYEEAGRGPAVVFAHGGGGDLSQWRHQMPAFAERYRAIAYDARGHGRSATANDYGMTSFVADLVGLLDHLEIGEAALVGATLGGVAVLELALAHPDRVRAVVLVSTAPDATDEMRARFEASAQVVESGDLAAFAEGYVGFIFSPDWVEGHTGEVADFRARLERIDPAGYAGAIRALGNRPDLGPRLASLRAPALVVTGAVDPIPTSAPGAEALLRGIPAARAAVIAGAAHLPQIERPREFDRLVLDFLATAGWAA